MTEETINVGRQINQEMDEPHIVSQVDRLVQIERRLQQTPRVDGTPRGSEEISAQALAIYRAMSGQDFCGGLEGALESHANAMRDYADGG